MLRILHCVSSLNMGGIETLLVSLYQAIDRTKIQFDFFVNAQEKSSYDDEIKALGGRIYRIPPRRDGYFACLKELKHFYKEHPEYTIVHQHVSLLCAVEPLWEAKNAGLPCRIVHSHNTNSKSNIINQILHHWNKKWVKCYATDYFACSDAAARWIYPPAQIAAGNYHIMHNAIDIERFRFDPATRAAVRQEFAISPDVRVIGHIGRFMPQKNHSYLIRIFHKIHSRDPHAVLLLVGDGPLRSETEAQVASLGLTEYVRFAGLRRDTPALYSAMDVFAMPSLHEGLPVVLVEAQTSGLTCFVSAGAVTEEAKVLQDRFSFLPLSDDPEQWADAVCSAPAYPRGMDCARQVAELYDIHTVAQELQSFYLSVGKK